MEFENGAIVKSWVNTDAIERDDSVGIDDGFGAHGKPELEAGDARADGTRRTAPGDGAQRGRSGCSISRKCTRVGNRRSIDSESARSLRTDKKSGLQVVI